MLLSRSSLDSLPDHIISGEFEEGNVVRVDRSEDGLTFAVKEKVSA
jgi:hypothetical protein